MTRIITAIFISLFAFAALAAEEEPGIDFDSVADALASLQENPDASIRKKDGWTIVSVKTDDEMSIWSFAPEDYPAYPAAVKREIVQNENGIYLDMKVLCESDKQSCDELVAQFEQLNEATRQKFGS